MSVVIQVNGLTKEYRISKMRRGYSTLREAIARSAQGIFQSRNGNAKSTIFRALDDVSFEVRSGEVIGLIGRNGAGKSTLLKILSRITEPTHGSADLEGRVGSLLEVGTGFHGELTGRENIYLNGAILGIRRESVKRQFDSILRRGGKVRRHPCQALLQRNVPAPGLCGSGTLGPRNSFD